MPQNVILDADYDTDVGDFGALSVAFSSHRLGWINLLGCIASVSYDRVPGAISAHAQWWGVSGLTFGCWKGTPLNATAPATNNFVGHLYNNFPRMVGLASTVADSTFSYRTMLASAPDGSVDIVVLGFLNAASALLDSPADGVSALTGAQLIAAKVRRLWVMGGQYPSGPAEWNFKGGGTTQAWVCAASDNVCRNWPTPIRFAGFELGDTLAGGTFGRPTTDIVSAAYTTGGYSTGRTAWDEQCVIACVQDGGDFTEVRGTQTVNTTTGVNTWTNSATGKDAYLVRVPTGAAMRQKLDALISANVSANPILTSWGSAPGHLQVRLS